MQCKDMHSHHSSAIWQVWLKGRVFVYALTAMGSNPIVVSKTLDTAPVSIKNFFAFRQL